MSFLYCLEARAGLREHMLGLKIDVEGVRDLI